MYKAIIGTAAMLIMAGCCATNNVGVATPTPASGLLIVPLSDPNWDGEGPNVMQYPAIP